MASSPFHPTLLREYDIRGTMGKTLFVEQGYEVAIRFVRVLEKLGLLNPMVCVARDGRLSSPALCESVIEGLRDGGAHVLDLGLGPTPMLYYGTQITAAVAGIMVTGSHNPPEDNGFKLTLKGRPFFGDQIQQLGQALPLPKDRGSLEKVDIKDSYLKTLLQEKGHRPLRVAWDCGNGATGELVEALTKHLPYTSFLLNTSIDGTFPAHHPDPTIPENLTQLRQCVHDNQCDLGIAFDGDGDRIGAIDSQGRIVWGDQLLSLFAGFFLRENPGATVMADIKSSQGFVEWVSAHGGVPLLAKTGHSHIKLLMKEKKIALAGEMSGHLFFADRYYGYDDALYAAVRLLALLASSSQTLSDYRDQLPQYHSTPELRLACSDEEKFEIVRKIGEGLRQKGLDFLDVDGIRFTTPQGWWLVRASNTQPILVARCEARHEQDLPLLIQNLEDILTPYGIQMPCL